jgi:cytosol alanyl aminopeptidase
MSKSTGRVFLVSVGLILAACGAREAEPRAAGEPSEARPSEVAPGSQAAPLRLPEVAVPLGYRAGLEVDPSATSFRGHIEIDVDVNAATDTIWLNAQYLRLQKAALRRGGASTALEIDPAPRNVVALRGKIPAGKATLVVDYTGKQDVALRNGMGRYFEAGDWYVVTHFEPADARRVFPCFDDPRFKVPWQLELTVPKGNMALTNTAPEKESALPDGRTRVSFKPTRPLPSYLIAIAVGPFEAVDAGKSRTGVPTRIVVPRGRGGDAAYAVKEVGKVLNYLEDYTAIPYDYGKLDHVVVPGTQRGAMEHPGLVTYGPRWLLIRKGESVAARRGQIGIVAHELAHQWFGNLVTLAWWDDLWLNEAFATWMTPKTIAAVHPEMDGTVEPVSTRAVALHNDTLATARRIRQPITAESDMRAAFDRITYSKGATVIRMFERWIGPETFQKAVREYLSAHVDGNATASDFLSALDKVAGDKPVGEAFASFLDQPGVPEISMELRCQGGPAKLRLQQRRHVPAGAASVAQGQTWQVPVCVAVPDGKERKTHCTLLTERTGELALGDTCPAWVAPNVDGAGYYLANLAAEPLAALLDRGWSQLSRVERLALVGDLGILVDGGKADIGAMLSLLPRLGRSDDPYLIDVAVTRLSKLTRYVAPEQREAFAGLVRETLGAAGRRIGWTPRPGEKLAQAKVRSALMMLLAVEGQDRAARQKAMALARTWLADHKKLPDSQWVPVMETAVRANAAEMVPLLLERLPKEEDRVAQRAMYQALALAPDGELQRKALALALSVDPIPPEMVHLIGVSPIEIEREATLFDFVRDNADQLLRRLPEDYQKALLVQVCDASRREEVARFTKSRLEALPEVGSLAVNQSIERMDQCITRRAAQSRALADFLAARK